MRADKFFADKYGSRTKAQQVLMRGLILCRGVPVSPKDDISGEEEFEFLSGGISFVSNGGFKLERGLSCFHESVEGAVAIDLGTSNGGFCDCLLKRGASRVYCVDVGKNQLDGSLRGDPRIVVMDGTNARYLLRSDFREEIGVITADLSFISLRLILPVMGEILSDGGRAFVLFKPQFECEGKGLGKNGILPVRCHEKYLKDFYAFATGLGFAVVDAVNAPVRPKKNIEYLLFLQKGGKSVSLSGFMARCSDFNRVP